MVTVLIISAKMANPGLLKINLYWNKGCKVIVSVYYVTNKNLACDWNYIVEKVIWRKFGNSGTSMREVIITYF